MRFLPLALLVAAAAVPSEDARFAAIWQAEWKQRVAEHLADDDPDAVSAHLADVSAAAHARREARWTDVLRRLDALDEAKLSPQARIDHQVYRNQIATLLDDERFREWEKPVNGDSAFWGDLQYAARGGFARGEADYRAYLSQLAEQPRYIDQQIASMRAGLARGFTPPAIVMQGRERPVVAIAEAKDPTATVYYEPFAKLPATIPAATRTALQAEARRVIAAGVIPAHQRLLAFLRTAYFPGLTETLAAEAYPSGGAYYRSRIRAFTTLDLSADQVHAIGVAEVAKIRAEMEVIRREVKFDGDLKAFLTFLRTDPRFYAKTPDQLLKEAAWLSKRFDGMAERWFGRLPRGRFAVKPVPDDIAPFYTAGRGGRDTYWVNTYDLPARPLFQLPALTLHESAPGHSFQISLAAENDDLPPFRRQSYISAYGEGWALYTERLGDEMGYYRDAYERFGMLSYQMWRAARLVIDTGIHSKGWTREQGQAFFRDNTALSEREITTEVDRYIGWPGQALSYYLGQLAIQRARTKAEKALGPKFDVRAFHDTVLSTGSVPLPVLEARIDRFIAEGGRAPYAELL
ncbi:DUF885 domain-containing protein [Sphingomonas lenta]|uniref:DUF885 domain-containing protein n=1 Tax=Sphingomonas lenta TaxID=1141887 RepID=A0A2A2SJM2_9SPHN|nr:DUF885 family protein [Sphingomonas lenta]PAX09474.1 DUF885 domain-containing protein [Sphingomonas lenta]